MYTSTYKDELRIGQFHGEMRFSKQERKTNIPNRSPYIYIYTHNTSTHVLVLVLVLLVFSFFLPKVFISAPSIPFYTFYSLILFNPQKVIILLLDLLLRVCDEMTSTVTKGSSVQCSAFFLLYLVFFKIPSRF